MHEHSSCCFFKSNNMNKLNYDQTTWHDKQDRAFSSKVSPKVGNTNKWCLNSLCFSMWERIKTPVPQPQKQLD